MATLEISVPPDFDVEDLEVQANQLNLRPIFFGNGRESAPCAMLTVKGSDGAVVSRYLIVMSGKSLTLELQDRSRPVMSAIERKLLEEKRAAVAAENAAG